VKEKKSSMIVEQSSPLYEQFVTASSYEFSGDKKYILITAQIVKLYRHSFLAIWQVYDIENKRLINVTVDNDNTPLYSLVKFAPRGASMIIVKDNNIYYKSSPLAPEIKITTSGTVRGQTLILNGIPDWVYEVRERILFYVFYNNLQIT
jgi:Dipeptidyl peptidase IV (DPP IV) N-terminal region